MQHLLQKQIDWLLSKGVTTDAIVRPWSLLRDDARPGDLYIGGEDAWWNVKTGQVAGVDWCLGDDLGERDCMTGDWTLTIHATTLEWLQAGRRGIVVIDWSKLFERVHDIPRISVPASLKAKYEKHMRPARLPTLTICPAGTQQPPAGRIAPTASPDERGGEL